jgi:hypothetical protein
MAYLLDLVGIIFIVILSYFFCMSNDKIKTNTNNTSCLLSHIVVGLSVIVFYKLAKHFKINDKLNKNYYGSNSNSNSINTNTNTKEKFTDSVTESINSFIRNTNTEIATPEQAEKMSANDLNAYSNKLDTLINNMRTLQNTINSPNPLSNSNPANLTTLDLSSQQQYQMFQIDYLNKQIKNAQDIINAQAIADSTSNYKPIKVFSSCVVSNANGSTTKEALVDSSSSSVSSGSSGSSGGLGGLQSSTGSQSDNTKQMLNTISQSNSQTNGPQLSSKTGAFQSFFEKLPSYDGVNITQ